MPRSGADGAIIIDSRIDTTGFNEGIASLGQQLKKIAAIGGLTYLSVKLWKSLTGFIGNTIKAVKRLARGFRMFIRGIEYISRIGRRIEEVQQEFENLRVQLYSALLPVIFAVLPAIYRIINALRIVARFIAFIIGALTGQTTILEANVKGANDLADATGRAKEEARGALAAFDEIDVLEQPTEDTGAGGGGALPDMGQIEIPIPEGILNFFERLREILEPLKEPLKELWDAIKLVASTLWDILVPAFEGMMEEGGFFETVIALLVIAIEWLTEKLIALAAWMEENPEKVLGFIKVILLLAAALGGALLLAVGLVIIIFTAVLVIIGFLVAAVAVFVIELIKAWPAIKAAIDKWGMKISEFVIKAKDKVIELWNKFVEFVQDLPKRFKAGLDKVIGFFIWLAVQAILKINEIRDKIQGFIANVKSWWRAFAEYLVMRWRAGFDNISDKVRLVIANMRLRIAIFKLFISRVATAIKDYFSDGWDEIKTAFETTWDGIVEFLRGIGTTIGDIFDGIIDGIRSTINSLISGINSVISKINGISINIPGILGGGTLGVDIGKIPYLADGAVIQPNAPFAAILGDQKAGRNIETPENLLREIVRDELANISPKVDIKFTGDLAALGRVLKPVMDKENLRIGKSMIQGVTR